MAHFKKILITYCLILSVGIFASEYNGGTAQSLRTKLFKVCGKSLKLEVADKAKERNIGLMNREGVPPGTGMLFVFPDAAEREFWMRNVPFEIDIGYFDSRGRLLTAMTMAGTSSMMKDSALPRYPSKGAAQYAVEAEKGFYKTLNTKKCMLTPLLKTQE